MSQLVWLEGKHSTQNAHCAVARSKDNINVQSMFGLNEGRNDGEY